MNKFLLFLIPFVLFSSEFKYLDEPPKYTTMSKYNQIYREMAYLQIYAISAIGVISILPKSVSNWEKDDDYNSRDLFKKHADNVAAGPVWDNDNLSINWIGHGVSGAYYYVWGRQSGLNIPESFILTTIMSTFYWEYGWEAFAEKPSIQDIFITPIIGSILGEITNSAYNTILENNGLIYGSKTLGTVSRYLINPIGELNKSFDSLLYKNDIELTLDYGYQDIHSFEIQTYVNFKLQFKY